MDAKAPVLLLVLVETSRRRWFVASVGADGSAVPLLRSEVGDLEKYLELPFDEQVSFLRHRFCGVLQRGCDRVWARGGKAVQFVFLFESPLPPGNGELTAAVAAHFVEWLLNPPVAVFTSADGFAGAARRLNRVAGDIEPALEERMRSRLGMLLEARDDEGAWELSPKKTE